MKKLAALATILALGAQPVMAEEASVFCIYDVLISTHIMATRCGQPLDAASEARYQKLLPEIAAFIVKNAPALNGKTDGRAYLAQSVKRKEASARIDAATCKNPQTAHFIKVLNSLVSADSAKKYSEFLKTPSDPNKGVCL